MRKISSSLFEKNNPPDAAPAPVRASAPEEGGASEIFVGNSIVIHGRVTGDVKANKRLEIQAPGRLVGNITTPVLVIHEGVTFEGQCGMGASEGRGEKEGKVTHLPTAEPAKAEAK